MKKIFLILTILISLQSFGQGVVYKILDTESVNPELWISEENTNSPMIDFLDAHKDMGIIVVCIGNSVYFRQINFGVYTPLQYRLTTAGGSASVSYDCDQYEKNLEMVKKRIEKQNKKNK
tara:strand:- start:70 stop:429 length:360 start_codon:yes stop_codon:yes gene_type:complete